MLSGYYISCISGHKRTSLLYSWLLVITDIFLLHEGNWGRATTRRVVASQSPCRKGWFCLIRIRTRRL